MTERGMGAFGLPTVAATLSTVAAMAFFVCLFSQGSLGTPGDASVRLNLAFADLAALQRDAVVQQREEVLHTRQVSLQHTEANVTDVPRLAPIPVTTQSIRRPAAAAPAPRKVAALGTIALPAAAAPPPAAVTPNVRVASLDAGVWQTRELHHIVPFDEPLKQARTKLVPFSTAPFPYNGKERGTNQDFVNVSDGARKGHRSWRGGVLWVNETYGDNRVLLHIPRGYNANKPGVMIVFFHGHRATLERDVWKRQQVPDQISAAGINAVLVAPQFAVDAADSSPGKFANPGAFARFLDESAKQLAKLSNDPAAEKTFAKMPVVIVAYSGGYVPAAWAIHAGGVSNRVQGVVLLDALYGELDKFIPWITKANRGFFVSAFTGSTRRQNSTLESILADKNVAYSTVLDGRKWRQGVTFLSTPPSVNHRDYVTRSWTENPIKDVLARLDEYKLPR
jgi:hypothetical protein